MLIVFDTMSVLRSVDGPPGIFRMKDSILNERKLTDVINLN